MASCCGGIRKERKFGQKDVDAKHRFFLKVVKSDIFIVPQTDYSIGREREVPKWVRVSGGKGITIRECQEVHP